MVPFTLHHLLHHQVMHMHPKDLGTGSVKLQFLSKNLLELPILVQSNA